MFGISLPKIHLPNPIDVIKHPIEDAKHLIDKGRKEIEKTAEGVKDGITSGIEGVQDWVGDRIKEGAHDVGDAANEFVKEATKGPTKWFVGGGLGMIAISAIAIVVIIYLIRSG